MQIKEHIEILLDSGKIPQAIEELTSLLCNDKIQTKQETSVSTETSTDEIHYLLGNAYYKLGNWKEAIQHYLEACEINDNSKAKEKLKMTYSILEFYNKDVYGQ